MRSVSTLVPFTDPHRYINRVVPFLEKNEIENGLFLGLLQQTQSDPLPSPPPVMIQIREGKKTVAAAFRRDSYLVVTRNIEGSCERIANHLSEAGVDLPGVAGPSASARRFAMEWSKTRGCATNMALDQGLYWLQTIDLPSSTTGRIRPLTRLDIPLVTRWFLAFQKEAVPFAVGSLKDARRRVTAQLQHKMTFIWEVDGAPVAMASLARPSRRGITINGVYTPPKLRGRGYATSLVAFLTHEGLSRGKEFCSLYTDMSNPTSNSIYRSIGYRLLSRARVYLFS